MKDAMQQVKEYQNDAMAVSMLTHFAKKLDTIPDGEPKIVRIDDDCVYHVVKLINSGYQF